MGQKIDHKTPPDSQQPCFDFFQNMALLISKITIAQTRLPLYITIYSLKAFRTKRSELAKSGPLNTGILCEFDRYKDKLYG